MDIKTLIGNTPRPEGTATATKPRGAPATADQTSLKVTDAVGESLTLTETAKTLSAAREAAQEAPFDSARVAGIRAAIADGSYSIDNQRLADSLLRSEGMLS
ncbi:flagellar biosynthesis anti-sigma factor FlgM [Thiocystis violacea]|uniref:flagellar biosynthesis anti-sigma factor FlgM n=1 Tax=Thiocystis violacea TaxID=13725 RepID=UPI00190392A9|nr:flagellar biosynthesis anti-sigma factor FlgM [Thiocystis violacea]MBK1716731.1 flagellar biosynthesis anti-sigma factor FlgM [Thiocystis violacea]